MDGPKKYCHHQDCHHADLCREDKDCQYVPHYTNHPDYALKQNGHMMMMMMMMTVISDNLIVDSNNADIDDKKDEKY